IFDDDKTTLSKQLDQTLEFVLEEFDRRKFQQWNSNSVAQNRYPSSSQQDSAIYSTLSDHISNIYKDVDDLSLNAQLLLPLSNQFPPLKSPVDYLVHKCDTLKSKFSTIHNIVQTRVKPNDLKTSFANRIDIFDFEQQTSPLSDLQHDSMALLTPPLSDSLSIVSEAKSDVDAGSTLMATASRNELTPNITNEHECSQSVYILPFSLRKINRTSINATQHSKNECTVCHTMFGDVGLNCGVHFVHKMTLEKEAVRDYSQKFQNIVITMPLRWPSDPGRDSRQNF
ncbi:unnamed protein product, partial [Didymodactylos carnosus]